MDSKYLKMLLVFAVLLFLLEGCAVSVRGGYYYDTHPYPYYRYHYHGYWR